MDRIRLTTATLIVCLLAQCAVFASDEPPAQTPVVPSRLTFNGVPLFDLTSADRTIALPADIVQTPSDLNALAQYGFHRGHGHHNDGAAVALFFGAIGTIAGTALLVYANRPECSVAPYHDGCGYGTKVLGGSVLAAGVVGLTIGAITWR